MPGFRHCSWCHGKGCMCCDAEQAKWEKAEAERRKKHAERAPDEIRQSLADLRWMRHGGPIDGVTLGTQVAVALAGRHTLDMGKIDAEIAKDEALLDAEYRRQFPDGPVPMLVVNRSDSKEMEILKRSMNADALTRAFSEGGGGAAEIEANIAKAKADVLGADQSTK